VLGLKFTTPEQVPECTPDPVMNAKLLRELYLKACPEYQGVFSVPMIWDRHLGTIVNNESEDILRMINSEDLQNFCSGVGKQVDLYPESEREAIDEWNDKSMKYLLVAAKDAGFAETQQQCSNFQHPSSLLNWLFE
jgi:putative glutathione S-transferase